MIKTTIAVGLLASALFIAPHSQSFAQAVSAPPQAPISSGNQDDKEAIGNKKAATSSSPTASAGSKCNQIVDLTQRQDCLTKESTRGVNNTGNDDNKKVAPNDKPVVPETRR